jgi:hypothetical protein
MQFLSCTVMFAGVNAQAMACLRDVLTMRGLEPAQRAGCGGGVFEL